jgi:cytochrome P450
MEILVILGTILRRFRLHPGAHRTVDLRAGIVLEPRGGVRVGLEPLT